MFVNERFQLNSHTKYKLRNLPPKFGSIFGEAVYFRTYSRVIRDNDVERQEKWADTIIRVVEGVFSIHKDHYIRNKLEWNDDDWQTYASEFAEYMFNMRFLPAGRGLWAMGSDQVYKRGSAALYNCSSTMTHNLCEDVCWIMDMLMSGVGCGAKVDDWEGVATVPDKQDFYIYVVPDSREGWVSSLFRLMNSYIPDKYGKYNKYPKFDFSQIRPAGQQLKTFGGISSGPKPLIDLLANVESVLDRYVSGELTKVRTVSDIINFVGCCVVAGNIRRSSEILLCDADSQEYDDFINLKNYSMYPERMNYGYMSNNSVVLSKNEHFKDKLPEIAKLIRDNGEPGFLNLINIQKYGRIGERMPDKACLVNPCGEIPLEHRETCNLSETFPARCYVDGKFDVDMLHRAMEFATFYCKTVSLLPTHHRSTNSVIARNRRIGVSISGITEFISREGMSHVIRALRDGYRRIKETDEKFSSSAGIPTSVRLSTIKPSGSISQLVGVPSGMHFPTFKYAIRRMRVSTTSKFCECLKKSGIPNELEYYRIPLAPGETHLAKEKYAMFGVHDENDLEYVEIDGVKYVKINHPETTVFEFPVDLGTAREAKEVSAWEQFTLLQMLQREWSDNMVSCTVYYNKETETDQIEHMLSSFAPTVKSVSLMPHSDVGSYPQMPYEGITYEEYTRRASAVGKIDWTEFTGSEGAEPKFCTGDKCEIY